MNYMNCIKALNELTEQQMLKSWREAMSRPKFEDCKRFGFAILTDNGWKRPSFWRAIKFHFFGERIILK